jgi:hypothetical protein
MEDIEMLLPVTKTFVFLLAFSAALTPVIVYGQAPARSAQPLQSTDCKTLVASDVVVIKLGTNERRLIFDGSVETPQIYRLLTVDTAISIGLDNYGGQEDKPSRTRTLEPQKVFDVSSWNILLTSPQPTTVCYARIGAARANVR